MAKSPAQDFAAVIVAAGRSSRLGGPLPKQFVELGGRLIVEHAIDRLAASPSVAEVSAVSMLYSQTKLLISAFFIAAVRQ